MGVKLLSTLLKTYCSDVVEKKHLTHLYGKKICIDAMIYVYRFKSLDALIEKFYLLCSILEHYNISPLFVFDGKPPEYKKKEINKRKNERRVATIEYQQLINKDVLTRKEEEEIMKLKRKMVYVTKEDIENIKSLIDSCGMKYIIADGEADRLCAALVMKKKVFAVLTEDMDLFALGCPNVLRYISLTNHTCLYYNLNKILEKLNITINDFQLICAISGNDYYDTNNNIFNYIKMYGRFKRQNKINSFMEWLMDNNIVYNSEKPNIEDILMIYKNVQGELANYKYIPIKIGYRDSDKLYDILEKDRFIFVR